MTTRLDAWIDRDLTAMARANELPVAFGVAETVSQCEDVLSSVRTKSPVLVGGPGVGKTSIVLEIVRRGVAGVGVPLLGRARVVQLSLRAIAARFKDKAQGANQFALLCEQMVCSSTPIVPYIRDLHLAFELDWEPTLVRFLSDLPHPILAEALPRQFEALVDYWSDLAERLVAIPVEEPAPAKVKAMITDWAAHQTQTTGRRFSPDALRATIELTARFMGDRPYPRKAFELLRHTVDLLGEDDGARDVTLRLVIERFSQLTRVPTRLVDPDEPLDLTAVHDFVHDRLLGQTEAVDAVVRMIALMKAGLSDLRRPFGAFLFVGPTGVGKTFCAQLLAEVLFGNPNRLVRLNLADYSEPFHVEVLFGDPNAGSVSHQRGLLARRLAGHPFGVLLLDEFEKANPKVHDAFLQLVDEGRYINGLSETVSVASLILIATSNAGAEVFRESGLGFDRVMDVAAIDRELDPRLHRQFRFELLNRFDSVVHFHPLDRTHIRAIARRELHDLASRDGLVSRGLTLEVDAEVLDWLVSHGYHPHFGARFLRREIERSVTGSLAEHIVRSGPPRGTVLALGVRNGRIAVRTVNLGPPPRAVVPTVDGSEWTVDPEGLRAGAQEWLLRFAPLAEEARHREAEAAALIDTSAATGFWDDQDAAQEVLRRYKAVDARVQADRRLLRPYFRLERAVADDAEPVALAELVSQVAVSHRRWIELGTDPSVSGVWVVLGPADTVGDCGELLEDLLRMYLGWSRRQGFQAGVVAEEVERNALVRVFLEVEGANVLHVLQMDAGEHRRRSERVLVEVIPRNDDGEDVGATAPVEDARHVRGLVVPSRRARVRVAIAERGIALTLHGSDRDTLALLARDLTATASRPSTSEVVRTYGTRGGAAHDPRTDVAVPLRDALRGNLEAFLRAWEVR